MTGFSQRLLYGLRLLDEWQALLLCFAAGAFTSLSFAPFHYWFLLPLALPLFYLLMESASGRRHALLRGFAYGYGFFMAGTYWIAYALAVDMEKFGWLIPISIVGLSAVMAWWFMLFGWLVWWRRSGVLMADLLRFIVLWVAVEYLRTLGMFGFPWNLLGYSAQASSSLEQLASLTGIYGLSLLMVALALLPVVWLKQKHGIGHLVYTFIALIALVATYGYGAARVPSLTPMTTTHLRLVQPNIPQSQKWTQAGRLQSLQVHAQLSQLPVSGPAPDAILWSETAMPFTLYPGSVWPLRLATLIPPGSVLITGAVRADDSGPQVAIWNSIVAIDAQAHMRGTYDKHQLVPFGEFVPLRSVLPLDKITPGNLDFSRGAGPQSLSVDAIPPFSPLVCYEVIFPWISTDPAHRPAWIFNATNDAWYGDSPGPYQHFAIGRMRAIEQGLPLVRVANTGISAVVDPYGRVVKALALGKRGVIDQDLPAPLEPTIYMHYRELPVLLLLMALWIFTCLYLRVRNR